MKDPTGSTSTECRGRSQRTTSLRAVRPARHRRVRVYQLLRTAHLERAHTAQPASIFYVDRRYDFDDRLAAGLDLIRAGTWNTFVTLLRSSVDTCEVNEPLVRSRLLRTLLAVFAVRISGVLARRRTLIVTYAIENRDPYAGESPVSARARVRLWLDRQMSHILSRQVDRIAFGTPGAQSVYLTLLGSSLRRSKQILVPALPAPCPCLTGGTSRHGMVFLGAFEERKGVPQLLAMWDVVSSDRPDLKLTIVGKGRLETDVKQFALERPSVDLLIDPPRAEIHSLLASARGLILLSQPQPRWREQVGLPIVEGLSHGCVIVTTTETGLAPWLSEHGHQVRDAGTAPAAFAQCVISANDNEPSARHVLDDLPVDDGRLTADEWLFAPPG